MSGLGVLSVHFEDGPCAVACPFCYLGAREPERLAQLRRGPPRAMVTAAEREAQLLAAVQRLDYAELAIALSEPVAPVRSQVATLLAAASARGRRTTITTTTKIALADPAVLRGATRVSLSVDPWKIAGDRAALLATVGEAARRARAEIARVEIIAIVTLSTPTWAEALIGEGLLEALVDRPELDGVALNALKPPPPFCDRAFWLDALGRLGPLLERALDRRLHLDCYVAARLLALGGCPARPDLSPGADGGLAFRSCVYAPRAEMNAASADELVTALGGFTAPATCPFETRL